MAGRISPILQAGPPRYRGSGHARWWSCDPSSRRLLIVNASPLLLEVARLLRLGMPHLGVHVTEIPSEALDLVCKEPYDVVVCESGVPGMEGLTLTNELRKRHPATKVLLVTSSPRRRFRAEAVIAGAHAVLERPLNMALVLAAVKDALRQPIVTHRT